MQLRLGPKLLCHEKKKKSFYLDSFKGNQGTQGKRELTSNWASLKLCCLWVCLQFSPQPLSPGFLKICRIYEGKRSRLGTQPHFHAEPCLLGRAAEGVEVLRVLLQVLPKRKTSLCCAKKCVHGVSWRSPAIGEQLPCSGKRARCQEADVADTPALVLRVPRCCQKCSWNNYKMWLGPLHQNSHQDNSKSSGRLPASLQLWGLKLLRSDCAKLHFHPLIQHFVPLQHYYPATGFVSSLH